MINNSSISSIFSRTVLVIGLSLLAPAARSDGIGRGIGGGIGPVVTATFTALSSTQEVLTVGLGAASTDAGSSGYPTIFAVGWCGGGQYGLYKCINFNPASLGSETWTLISHYIGTYGIGLPVCVAGDPNQEGRCIMGTNGNGAAIFQESGKVNGWF